MLTKSVIACLVGTVLANAPCPNSQIVSTAYATLEVSGAVDQAQGSHPTTHQAPQERASRSRRGANSRTSVTTTNAVESSAINKKGAKSRLRHLGAFTVRAYTYEWDDDILARTASGTFPIVGRTVAVDPRVIPLGSTIYIEGLGERVAEDSGGKIKGRMLDLLLPSDYHCRQFGVRQHNVRIVEK